MTIINKTPAKDSVKDYPALDCPLCGKERRPTAVNKDGSVRYRCKPDHINHGNTYTWRILKDGSLVDSFANG